MPAAPPLPAQPQPGTTFALPSFAKINLSLRVLGRRASDGYHELRTVFQTISLHDELTFAPRADGRVELLCDAPQVPADETNLVCRAAAALRERFDIKRGARVELRKRIPAGGGLGGGSSNAAVALVGLAHLWGVDADARLLEETGARLGADVPFFFTGGTALGTGLGTEIHPLPDAPVAPLLVVNPGTHVSTAEAYKLLSAPALTKEGGTAKLLISRGEAEIPDSLCGGLANDFERVILGRHPEIARARAALLKAGASCALLCGSGASVFGLFDNAEERDRAGAALGGNAGWQVFACDTLARRRYVEAFAACGKFLRAH